MQKSITALEDTWLKKKPIQSDLLSESDKVFCPKDKFYLVDSYEDAENHIKVVLSYGAGTWYIWGRHWDNNWDDDHVKSDHPAVIKEIEQLKAYTGKIDLGTSVKNFSQRDNPYINKQYQYWRTCNSSANCMYYDWWLRATGLNPKGTGTGAAGDIAYLKKASTYGDSIQHWVQTKVLDSYGCRTKWSTDGDTPYIIALLKAGIPVVCNILHKGPTHAPSGGHIIILIDYKDKVFTAHDPWGSLVSGYKNHNGAYSKISLAEFKARSQGGYRQQR